LASPEPKKKFKQVKIGEVIKTNFGDVVEQPKFNLLMESGPDFVPGNIFERGQDRSLNFRLDSHLHYSGSIARQFCGDKLQDLLLTSKIFSLLV
jgi:hypothetical protein